MTGMHDLILLHVQSALQKSLIDDPKVTDDKDPAIAGVIKLGPLQGDPTPDDARISVTLHENDPDAFIPGEVTGMTDGWDDEVDEIEIGGASTTVRRFTAKARCLLVNSTEDLAHARSIASTVRDRMEVCLLHLSFAGVETTDEMVTRNVISEEFRGEMLQSGGPDSYDYFIKVRFSVLTTRLGVIA
jgi:hypothetical protein